MEVSRLVDDCCPRKDHERLQYLEGGCVALPLSSPSHAAWKRGPRMSNQLVNGQNATGSVADRSNCDEIGDSSP
jgi:hypothetical protein